MTKAHSQLLREARFCLTRFEEDADIEELHAAISFLVHIDEELEGEPELPLPTGPQN